MMCPEIDNPTSCKIRALIQCLRAKNKNAAEIYPELYSVYDKNIMSEGTVRQWCRMF
jgi:hypothetical protein